MRFYKLCGLVFTIVVAAVNPASAAVTDLKEATAGAKPVVDSFYGSLLETMKEGDKLGFQGRKTKLEPVVRGSFDLPLMARAVVGPSWYKLKPEDQTAITSAFSDWAVSTYASRFTSFNGEQFAVGETSDAGRGTVQVKSTIKPKAESAVVLSYRLKHDGKAWRIVDVYLGGSVSQLSNWRKEFNTVSQSKGALGLIERLKELSRDLAKVR